MKKIVALLVAMLTCLPVLVSCADSTPDTAIDDTSAINTSTESSSASAENAETEITRENYPDTLPELNFGGETAIIQVGGNTSWISNVYVEELTGEAVNDAIFNRNKMVEERLNIKIGISVGDTWENYSKTITAIRGSIAAADGAFDTISGWSAMIPILSLEGLFMNLNDIEHLDLDMPWWNQSCNEELQISNKLYFSTGDITNSLLSNLRVYVVNRKVAEDRGVEELYDVVREHRWTIDYVHDLISGIYVDLNGDGVKDENDMYGLTTSSINCADSYMQGFRVSMISRDEEGLPVLDVDQERMTTVVEKVYELMWNNPGCYAIIGDGTSLVPFMDDRTLLATTGISSMVGLADMESDFGVLPYPLLDESQEEYGTRVHDSLNLWSIPIDVKNTALSGAMLEALAAQSYRTVTPVYFDVTLKNRYSRDPATAEMIDLIKNSVLINFESLYNEVIGEPWYVLRKLMPAKSNNFASHWARKEKAIIKKLADAVELIEALD